MQICSPRVNPSPLQYTSWTLVVRDTFTGVVVNAVVFDRDDYCFYVMAGVLNERQITDTTDPYTKILHDKHRRNDNYSASLSVHCDRDTCGHAQ